MRNTKQKRKSRKLRKSRNRKLRGGENVPTHPSQKILPPPPPSESNEMKLMNFFKNHRTDNQPLNTSLVENLKKYAQENDIEKAKTNIVLALMNRRVELRKILKMDDYSVDSHKLNNPFQEFNPKIFGENGKDLHQGQGASLAEELVGIIQYLGYCTDVFGKPFPKITY